MSPQHQFENQPNVADARWTFGGRTADVGPMSNRDWSDVRLKLGRSNRQPFPAFWTMFCQTFYHPSTRLVLLIISYIMFPISNITFDVLKMSRYYHIPKHILGHAEKHAEKHDIPMTSLKHQCNLTVRNKMFLSVQIIANINLSGF